MLQDEVSRNHCTSRSTLTPSPHSWQMNASIMVKLGKYSALRSVGSECCKSPRLRVPPIYGRRGQWETVSNGAARVALEIRHISAFLDDDATVAVRAGGDFVRDDQIAAFVLMHDLRL